jgi:hypothetical protein
VTTSVGLRGVVDPMEGAFWWVEAPGRDREEGDGDGGGAMLVAYVLLAGVDGLDTDGRSLLSRKMEGPAPFVELPCLVRGLEVLGTCNIEFVGLERVCAVEVPCGANEAGSCSSRSLPLFLPY